MSIITMVKNIKEVHKEYVVMYKVGNFYKTYGKDAYIMSYIFGYQISFGKDNMACSGFPIAALLKVIAKLEQKKINYLTLDVRNNYDVDEKQENGNLNKYNEVLEKATRYVKLKRRIDDIHNFLLEEIESENVKEYIKGIEKIIYDGREV